MAIQPDYSWYQSPFRLPGPPGKRGKLVLPDTPLRVVICSPYYENKSVPDALRFTVQMVIPAVEESTFLSWLAVQLDMIGNFWGYRDCTVRVRGVKGGVDLFWGRDMVLEEGQPTFHFWRSSISPTGRYP